MRGVLVLVMWFLPAALFAEGALLAQARAPLFDTGLHQNAQTGGASLFTGAVGDSFLHRCQRVLFRYRWLRGQPFNGYVL